MLELGRSLLSSKSSSSPTPFLTFVGPDSENIISLRDSQGSQTPLFIATASKNTKPQLHVTRIKSESDSATLCTATTSSLSTSIILAFNGQDLKLKTNWDNISFNKVFAGPTADLQWKASTWGDALVLSDDKGSKLARYQYKKASGDPRLEIFVQSDDSFVELILATGVAVLKMRQQEDKEEEIVSEVVEYMFGVGVV